MKVDSVVVGAGISGISLARRLAEENGERVLLVERKNHIGGGLRLQECGWHFNT